jgi:hypothetical protein
MEPGPQESIFRFPFGVWSGKLKAGESQCRLVEGQRAGAASPGPERSGHRRVAKGMPVDMPAQPAAQPPAVCRVCGVDIDTGRRYCASCGITVSRENLIELGKRGRVAGHRPEARKRQAENKRRHDAEVKVWNPTDKPEWLTEELYRAKIQPRLTGITVRVTSSNLGISEPYAALIRAGRKQPHPRYWLTLAQLVGVSQEE